MKKLIYLTFILFSLVSCENDMPFNVKDNPPKLIINTLLDISKTENEINLALTGKNKVTNVKNAQIDIYVNGVLKEQITNPEKSSIGKNYSAYKTHIKMQPADIIKIEVTANDGEYHAWAEDIVPNPINIEKAETSVFTKQTSYWSSGEKYLKAKTTFTDNQQGVNYYRISMDFEFYIETISPYTHKDTIIYQKAVSGLIVDEDVVLTDGQPSVNDNDDDIFVPIYNEYGVFDNSRINGTYTMTTSTQIPYYMIDYGMGFYGSDWYNQDFDRVAIKGRIRLMSISKMEYLYLKALNIYDSVDYDDYFNLPVKFPSNVQGGVGIVGVCSGNELMIPLEDYIPNSQNTQ